LQLPSRKQLVPGGPEGRPWGQVAGSPTRKDSTTVRFREAPRISPSRPDSGMMRPEVPMRDGGVAFAAPLARCSAQGESLAHTGPGPFGG